MNVKSFSVRLIVAESFSICFSRSTIPLVVVGCLNLVIFSIVKIADYQAMPGTETLLKTYLGEWGSLALFLSMVGINVLILSLSFYMFAQGSLYLVNKKSIVWSESLPSWALLIRFCKVFSMFPLFFMMQKFELFIPALLGGVRFGLFPYFLLETHSLIDALKKSWNITTGYSLKIVLCIMLVLISGVFMTGFVSGFIKSFVGNTMAKGLMNQKFAQLLFISEFVFACLCLKLLVCLLLARIYTLLTSAHESVGQSRVEVVETY